MRVRLILRVGLIALFTSAAADAPSLTGLSPALIASPQGKTLTVSAAFATPTAAGAFPLGPDPTEPLVKPNTAYARVKSPQQQMHFTAGLPFRFLADGFDPDQWRCPPGHPPYQCPDAKMEYLIDGVPVGTQLATDPKYTIHGWELDLPNGLQAGRHVLTVRYTPHDPATNAGRTPVNGLVPVVVHVDPLPAHAATVNLTSDLVLTGSKSLIWNDAVVNGNGHKVTAATGYRGTVTIQNSFVTGLSGYGGYSLDVTTSGAVHVERSIFESTAPLRFHVSGSASLTVRGNEFRANNLVNYVLNDPSRSPILDLSGTTTGPKVVAGNNIGGGILLFADSSGWQIGGPTDADTNVLIGPRAVIGCSASTGSHVQMNYDHHLYDGVWSQGYNLDASYGYPCTGMLAEQNVIRGGSWPVQSVAGEFRDSLVLDDDGHDSWRTIGSGTSIHHNIFVYVGYPNSGYDGQFMTYSGETGITIYNNTFDAGGTTSQYSAPWVRLMNGAAVASLRNNAVVGFTTPGPMFQKGLVNGAPHSVGYADYNFSANPLAPSTPLYAAGVATQGGHDKSGTPQFIGAPDLPYRVDEGLMWTRQYTVSRVLAYYRQMYTPAPRSPLIDAGDPNDGQGTDIGAVSVDTPSPPSAHAWTQPAQAPTPTTHPLIWLDAARRAILAKKVAMNDPTWRAFKAHADTLLTYSVPAYDRDACAANQICYNYEGGGWFDALSTLGLTYQLTKDTRYSAKVLQVIDAMNVAGAAPEQVDSGFPSRSAAAGLALGFDWCYDQLGATRKAATIATLNGYYDWAKANAFDFGVSSSAAGNYFGGHLLGFGLAGLATVGDNTRASEITRYVRDLYNSIVAPSFASGFFQSGYPFEGYVYGTNHFVRLLEYMVAVKTATGEDLLGGSAAKIAHSLLYSLKPNRWQFPDEADYPGDFTGIMDPTLVAMLPTLMPPGTADAAYTEWQYQHLAQNPAGLTGDPTQLFVWYDPSLPATDYRRALPVSWYSPGDEHLFARTDWTDNAVWFSIRALNALVGGHQLRGAGNIEVQRGNDYLIVNAGQWKGRQGWGGNPQSFYSTACSANTLMYRNPWDASYCGGQGAWGTNATIAHAETPTYAYLIADLASPYKNRIPTGLKAFTRAFVSLQDGNAVVCDHVEAGAATDSHELVWHLNPATVPVVNGQTVTTTVGASKLQIATFGMQPVAVTLGRDHVSDADAAPTTYRVQVNDTSGSSTLNVLTVLSAFASSGTAPPISSLSPMSVQVGSRVVTCSPDASSVTVK